MTWNDEGGYEVAPEQARPGQTLGYANMAHPSAIGMPVYDNTMRAKLSRVFLLIYGWTQIVAYCGALAIAVFVGTNPRLNQTDFDLDWLWLVVPFAIAGCVGFIASILGIVFYMMWQYRAVWNSRAVGNYTTHTPGWSVGWWFIPIANLFVLRTILRDVWTSSGAAERTNDTTPPGTLYTLWALSFVLSIGGAVYDGVLQFQRVGRPPTRFQMGDWINVGIDAVAGVLFIAFIFLLAWFVMKAQESAQPATDQPPTYFQPQ